MVLKKEKTHDSVDEIILNYIMSSASQENYIDFLAVGNTGIDYSNHT